MKTKFILLLLLLLLLFCLCNSVLIAQNIVVGKVVNVISSNTFTIRTVENQDYEVTINDTKQIDSEKKKAFDYLYKKILKEKVIVTVTSMTDSKILGSVLYNCVKYENISYDKTDIPCSQGNVLDVEMIKLGLLEYVGKNEFLVKIGKG